MAETKRRSARTQLFADGTGAFRGPFSSLLEWNLAREDREGVTELGSGISPKERRVARELDAVIVSRSRPHACVSESSSELASMPIVG